MHARDLNSKNSNVVELPETLTVGGHELWYSGKYRYFAQQCFAFVVYTWDHRLP